MKAATGQDPLVFWHAQRVTMPILFGNLRRVLPARACCTDVERFFSLTGRICSPLRSNLLPAMVNKLACTNL